MTATLTILRRLVLVPRSPEARHRSDQEHFGRTVYIIEGIKALTNIKTYHIRGKSAETQMEDDFHLRYG